MDRRSNGVGSEAEPILLIYSSCEMAGPAALSGDHWALRDIIGYQSDDDLGFYTNDMHTAVLDDIGNKVAIFGRNLNSIENKINTLVALFEDNSAVRGQQHRAVIHIKSPL